MCNAGLGASNWGGNMTKLTTKFMDIANRITGFSTPVFGMSWNPPIREAEIARRLIIYLEDRRALYVRYDQEDIIFVQESILDIRRRLTTDLEQLESSSPLAGLLSTMRTACRNFLHKTQAIDARAVVYGHGNKWNKEAISFFAALGELRATLGICIAQICVRYGIDIEEQMAAMLPPASESIPDVTGRFGLDGDF
jgi:hypothetical protein